MDSMKTALVDLQKRIVHLETSGIAVSDLGVVHASSIKVHSYDGSNAWTAYRQQSRQSEPSRQLMDRLMNSEPDSSYCYTQGQAQTVLKTLPSSGYKEQFRIKIWETPSRTRLLRSTTRQNATSGRKITVVGVGNRKTRPKNAKNTANTVQAFADGIKSWSFERQWDLATTLH